MKLRLISCGKTVHLYLFNHLCTKELSLIILSVSKSIQHSSSDMKNTILIVGNQVLFGEEAVCSTELIQGGR